MTKKPSSPIHIIKLCALTLILGCGPLASEDQTAEELVWALAGAGGTATGGTGGQGTPRYMNQAPARQSTTAFGGVAARASDLFSNGDYAAGSVSHTDFEHLPWWQTPTRSENPASVTIWNRTDCCRDRLGTFEIWFWSNQSETWTRVGPFDMDGQIRFEYTVPASNDLGAIDHVRIQKTSAGYLSLAEVVVMGR